METEGEYQKPKDASSTIWQISLWFPLKYNQTFCNRRSSLRRAKKTPKQTKHFFIRIVKSFAESECPYTFSVLSIILFKSLSMLFTRNSAGEARTLRNTSTGLKIPKTSSVNGQRCFLYRGVKLWNSLSTEAERAPTLGTFKILTS